ncbi:aspartate aminotransferase family protein [Candidatus Omnitrophota bacterium]
MTSYNFLRVPKRVPLINTKYRKIKTEIPVPESISILEDLDKYESRSMHGQLPVVWDRAEDFQVFDKYGNCWIDFTSTIFLANTGHSNPMVIKALKRQLDQKLIHTYTFAHEIRARFLKKLIEMTPDYLEKVFLLSAGTEATECAIKLMRMHGQAVNPSKIAIVSFKGSMHGRTMGAEMLKGDPKISAWIGYMDPNIYHLPFPYPWIARADTETDYDWAKHFYRDIDALKEKKLNFDNITGFIIESYLGWGAIFYPPAYIQALVTFAKEHNILVTFDEIQGGFGRSGKLFAYQHYDVEPDLICLGKALSGGLPLSTVVGRGKIMDLPEVGSMSSTHSGNPLCCAAALANLEVIGSGDLIQESLRKGLILHGRLNEIKNRFPNCISYIFGKGLLAGIIFGDPLNLDPNDIIFASKVCERAMQKGLLLVYTGRESIKIGPPLTILDDALMEGLDVLEEVITEISDEEK